jgi:hypothetical protein
LSVWLVIYQGLRTACWECEGGGDCELFAVAAPTREEALQRVDEHLRLRYQDDPWVDILRARRSCVRLRRSRHRKARLLNLAQVLAELEARS